LWQKLITKGMVGHVNNLVAHIKIVQRHIGSFEGMGQLLSSQDLLYETYQGFDDKANHPYEMVWWIKFRANYVIHFGMINGGNVIRAQFIEEEKPFNKNLQHIQIFITEDSINYSDDCHGYDLPTPAESNAFIACLESHGVYELSNKS